MSTEAQPRQETAHILEQDSTTSTREIAHILEQDSTTSTRETAHIMEQDLTTSRTSKSIRAQGALVHAMSSRVKFLGVYIAAVVMSKQKRREAKGLEKRRRVIHRLHMLQKQRQTSWEKEAERLVLKAWIRGYRKAISTLRSSPQNGRQVVVKKAAVLGMKTALNLTEGDPTESRNHLKKLLEEEKDHFSRQGWAYLPLRVKGAYENFLLSIDEACDELKVQAAALKRLQRNPSGQERHQNVSSQDNEYDPSSSLSRRDDEHFFKPTMDRFDNVEGFADITELQPADHQNLSLSPTRVDQNVHKIIDRIADPHALLASYSSIKARLQFAYLKEGEVGEEFDWNWFNNTAHSLKTGKYEFTPVEQVDMRKPGIGGQMRSHALVCLRDQIVEEAIRVELESIYDPMFLQDSHGFRPGKSRHSALKAIKNGWKGTSWFLDVEIDNRYGISNQKRLLDILSERIQDQRLLNMLEQMLAVGIIDMGGPMCENGSLLSALLCNIYYHQLDLEIARIKSEVNIGSKKRDDITGIARTGGVGPGRRKQNHQDPEYIRVRYVRFADEFLIGITGSKAIAQDILGRVKHFLVSNLKLRFR
jgi:hypothetical protein